LISAEERKRRVAIPTYSLGEELISSISHGVGALLGIAALVLCIVKSCNPLDGFKLASSIVFGTTTVILYLMSCLYHALKVNRAKRVFRVFDHCTIFLLIAGTYTPFTLVTLRNGVGWWLFGVIWLIAVVGIVLNAVSLKKFAKVSVACYLIMGWMVLFSFPQLKTLLDPRGITLLVAGGCVYTLGAILYGIGSKKKYFHSIFHFFCLGGTVLHFFAIYLYVL
jgi:hemolysin III